MQGSADRVAHAPACFAEALRRQARWGGDGSQRWHHKSRICVHANRPTDIRGGGEECGRQQDFLGASTTTTTTQTDPLDSSRTWRASTKLRREDV